MATHKQLSVISLQKRNASIRVELGTTGWIYSSVVCVVHLPPFHRLRTTSQRYRTIASQLTFLADPQKSPVDVEYAEGCAEPLVTRVNEIDCVPLWRFLQTREVIARQLETRTVDVAQLHMYSCLFDDYSPNDTLSDTDVIFAFYASYDTTTTLKDRIYLQLLRDFYNDWFSLDQCSHCTSASVVHCEKCAVSFCTAQHNHVCKATQ